MSDNSGYYNHRCHGYHQRSWCVLQQKIKKNNNSKPKNMILPRVWPESWRLRDLADLTKLLLFTNNIILKFITLMLFIEI